MLSGLNQIRNSNEFTENVRTCETLQSKIGSSLSVTLLRQVEFLHIFTSYTLEKPKQSVSQGYLKLSYTF